MNRQSFIRNSMLASAALMVGTERSASALSSGKTNGPPFRMKFSPEFDIFKELGGKDVVDQIKWGHDNGFRAWENTFLARRPVVEQERISKTIQQLGMEFGQFVGTLTFKDATFASRNKAIRDNVLQDVKASIEIAKRMNTKYIHNVLGMSDPKLPWDFQMANAIELLKQIADLYEPHGLIMVMETMNHRVNHPGMFLHTIPQAYAMAKAVGSPSLKLLFDVYHVQIQEGNLMDTLDYAWDEIAYLQVGDAPGRNEPTTGEINFVNVLQHVYDKGYRGFVGLEHGIKNPGKEGEQKALVAYRSIDPH
ncbi:hydroxypyruvate isomerase family protein [Spirosoma flavum]|uniref:Hydroxypyruvate isomerase family protein n=1 Tax=Spirosoma flavum TaxID=2048557 RepID=A0ABW6AJM8_9BACT